MAGTKNQGMGAKVKGKMQEMKSKAASMMSGRGKGAKQTGGKGGTRTKRT